MSTNILNSLLPSNPTSELRASPTVEVQSNWNLIGGTDINKAVETIISHEDLCIHPQLNNLINEEHAVLLARSKGEEASADACEIKIRLLLANYKIDSLSLVCSAKRIEFFLGASAEYLETIYGERIEEDGETATESTHAEAASLNYRYDVEVKKSGVVQLALKFLTAADELCLYGALLYVIPNPNGITTSQRPQIDMQNVQQMLSDCKSAPEALKFLKFYGKLSEQQLPNVAASSGHASSSLTEEIKCFIDQRLNIFEGRILLQLQSMEKKQTEKLDKIINLIEKKQAL